MSVRKVIQAGHPSLKTKNKTLTSFNSPKLKKLIRNLKDTMYKTDLVGIAAPQIAENYMVFVTHPRNTKARKLFKEDICRAYVNPKITKFSKGKIVIYEGCGCVAEGGIFGPVLRSKEITVEAFDESNNKFSLTCDGLLARVIQHEYDHLMGIEFIQKVNDYNKILAQTFYRKNIRNSKEQKEASKITKIEFRDFGYGMYS